MATAQEMKPMELEGSLKAFKFPEILQFLAMGHMTGSLSLSQEGRGIVLVFKNGRIIGASSEERCLRLGQMLVYAGKLNRQGLEEALEGQQANDSGKRLGEILVDRQLITNDELKAMLKLQIEEEIWELFSWEDGSFRFEQGPVSESDTASFSLEVEPLLLEGSRRVDEWQTICASINNPNEVFRVNPDLAGPPEGALDPNTWKILSNINGSLSVEALVRISNLGKFETYYALDHLLRSEIIVNANEAPTNSAIPRDRLDSSRESTNPGISLSAVGSVSGPSGDGEDKPSIMKFFGRKKLVVQPGGENGIQSTASSSTDSTRPGTEYFTDVGLVCAMMNHLIDRLCGDSKFLSAGDPPNLFSRMWFETMQRFPKADLVRFAGNKLSGEKFERYVEAEGASISQPLQAAHDDSLEALKMFWDKLKARAEERLDERGASSLFDKAMKPYLQCGPPKVQAGEFSLSRWKENAS